MLSHHLRLKINETLMVLRVEKSSGPLNLKTHKVEAVRRSVAFEVFQNGQTPISYCRNELSGLVERSGIL